MNQSLRHQLGRIMMPVLRRAASSYIAGPELADALAMVESLRTRRSAATIAFWDEAGAAPADVLKAYVDAASALQANLLDCYVSVKAPSVRYSSEALMGVVEMCVGRNIRLHFDSLGYESAEPTRVLIERLLKAYGNISFTLPGRWQRSLEDAEWAVQNGIAVRVVKGQWEDTTMPGRDPQKGFLEVIERLAGRAGFVAVATHNPTLAAESLTVLRKAGTPCELELLFGLPSNAVLKVAKQMAVRTRVYVPYGYGWLPYSLSQARRNPRIIWWMLKDAIQHKTELAA